MNSLLLNWFDDWGLAIRDGLGTTWLIILVCVFTFCALFLMQDFFRSFIKKAKIEFKWLELIFTIIFVLFVIWFCVILGWE